MTDDELIGYCEIHCETPRALFSSEQINRMLALAGHPAGFPKRIEDGHWVSVKGDMAELCQYARERAARLKLPPPDNVVILSHYRSAH